MPSIDITPKKTRYTLEDFQSGPQTLHKGDVINFDVEDLTGGHLVFLFPDQTEIFMSTQMEGGISMNFDEDELARYLAVFPTGETEFQIRILHDSEQACTVEFRTRWHRRQKKKVMDIVDGLTELVQKRWKELIGGTKKGEQTWVPVPVRCEVQTPWTY